MNHRHNPTALRASTARRDRGICSSCGLDCGALEVFREAAFQWLLDTAPVFDRGARPAWAHAQLALLLHAAEMPMGPLWIADHRVPFEMGGADQLSNIQTLCWLCNKKKTRGDVWMICKAQRIQAKGPRKHFGFGR